MSETITPTPWRVCKFPHSGSDVPWSIKDADGVVIIDAQSEKLARNIVRAANAHDALVEACKTAIGFIERDDNYSLDSAVRFVSDKLMAALSLADEERA